MPDADLHDLAAEYRSEFPIFDHSVYLNSCSLGALSRSARDALTEFADLWARRGAAAWYEDWLTAVEGLRGGYAELIGAERSEVALAPSVSAALSVLASALDFSERPRVVTTELDFPTIIYQFLAKQAAGVETVILPSPDGVTVPVETFSEAVDERTALVATSHVFYSSGAIQDVATVAELAHERGALCLVDAYQSTGQLSVDARELGLDFLVSGALKWLLGGPGLAFAYVRRELVETLRPTAVSWFGVVDPFAFDPWELELRGDARRFELGTPSVAAAYTARAGLDIVTRIGVDRIRSRVSSLAEDLIDRARSAGLEVRAARSAEARSGIVMVERPDPAADVRKLAAAGVVADRRAGAVRLSPHFYNVTSDNERAIEVLVRP